MKRGLLLLLLISLGLNLGLGFKLRQERRENTDVSVMRQGRHHRGRPAAGDTAGWRSAIAQRVERIAAHLELRPDQADAFAAAQRSTGKIMGREQIRLQEARHRLRELTAQPPVDPVAVRSALLTVRRAQARLDSLAAESLLVELAILDPGQQARYLELLPLERGPGRKGEMRPPQGGRRRGVPPDAER